MQFYGGTVGALLPFFVFVTGVIAIALSGAPDEKGFWPVLILAIGLGLLLSKNKTTYSNAVLSGMSENIVMIMITAWILASIIGVLMTITGFVEGLTWLSSQLNLGPVGFVLSSFIICSIVSLSTGSSFATILICGPILYPVGGILGSHLPTLAGAILAGATFGDFFAPISDTTISSTLSQQADIGRTVRSRLYYIIPAAILALFAFYCSAYFQRGESIAPHSVDPADPKGLAMLAVPAFIIYLFLRGKHLLHGLLMGLLFGTAFSLLCGLLSFSQLFSLDPENYSANSFVIDGIQRSIGISIFTILLMGLVGVIKANGLMKRLLHYAEKRTRTQRQGETWIAFVIGAAVLLTTHSVVAILMVADFVKSTGQRLDIGSIRRANIMSLVACIFPFLLPYFIPVILMSSVTITGEDFDIASVAPFEIGIHNFLSWALLVLSILTIGYRYRRTAENTE